ncbi:GPRGPH [Trypoxylus dichotomus]
MTFQVRFFIVFAVSMVFYENDASDNVTSTVAPCPDGHFHCFNTSNVCIHQSKNCDGHLDCPLGEDEELCDDFLDSLHWDSMFRKRPSAEDDHDDDDETCKLNYNGKCICRHKDILCHHKNFIQIPENLPREFIHLLDFTGNYFKIVGPMTVVNIPHHVMKLVLKQCNIEELLGGVFYNMTRMKKLYMDNNKLKLFPSNLFESTNQLEVLILAYNQIANIDLNAFEHLSGLTELDLSYNKLTDLNRRILEPLTNLSELLLRGNLLKSVRLHFFPGIPLLILSLMENQIDEVEVGSFAMLPTLLHLFLSYNKIKILRNNTFQNLSNLLSLTLNDNKLTKIDSGVFLDVTTLKSLNFERNPFSTLDRNVLKPLNSLQHVYFERFEKCIAAPHVRVCYPKGDGISSYEHLLHNPVLRASVWVMAAVGCVGNIIVLLGRLLVPTNNVVHSLYIKNLAFSDLLMGVYLFAIAGADQNYRGVYLQHEYEWRHSSLCNICGK